MHDNCSTLSSSSSKTRQLLDTCRAVVIFVLSSFFEQSHFKQFTPTRRKSIKKWLPNNDSCILRAAGNDGSALSQRRCPSNVPHPVSMALQFSLFGPPGNQECYALWILFTLQVHIRTTSFRCKTKSITCIHSHRNARPWQDCHNLRKRFAFGQTRDT